MAIDPKIRKPGFLILEGRDAGRVIPIERTPFSIGRLPENELVVGDEQVSRKHAVVEQTGEGYRLVDCDSRNGIFVDERKVKRHDLQSGDRVRIGSTTLVFHGDSGVAHEVMAQSVPDSPAFALSDPGSSQEYAAAQEEPTAIRYADSAAPHPAAQTKGWEQAERLFLTTLPPQGCASQLLDILFQSFSPDRSQLFWGGLNEIHIARSRKEGKKCSPFDLPPELLAKAKGKIFAGKTAVPVSYGSGSEERMVLLSHLSASAESNGWIYLDRPVDQPPFGPGEAGDLASFGLLASGVLDRAALSYENRRLRTQISLMEKHISPEVSRHLASKGMSVEESSLSVERREVTILFSDIVGFTPLSERLSAEDLARLLNEYFQRMVDVILDRSGMPNKFIGDAIMALFGAPEVHGDDAVHAVSAGLGMVEALKNFWNEIDEKKRFHIRVGINTGEVVAGNIGSEKKMEYTVLGDAVNVASRLEGISQKDHVTIGPRTAELVRHAFELKELPAVKVKGKSHEMNIFQVVGPKKVSS